MERYGLYFSYAGVRLRLPVNPSKLPVSMDGDNEDYNVLGIGPITIPRLPRPRKIKISSYFPAQVNPFVFSASEFHEPQVFIQFFTDAMQKKLILTYSPVRYNEQGIAYNSSDDGFRCLVSSFSVEERGGETGDFYYDLSIVEWKDYTPSRVEIESGFIVELPARATSPEVIVRGDTVTVSGPTYPPGTGGTKEEKEKVKHETLSEAEVLRTNPNFVLYGKISDAREFQQADLFEDISPHKTATGIGTEVKSFVADLGAFIEKLPDIEAPSWNQANPAYEHMLAKREDYDTVGDFMKAMVEAGPYFDPSYKI